MTLSAFEVGQIKSPKCSKFENFIKNGQLPVGVRLGVQETPFVSVHDTYVTKFC